MKEFLDWLKYLSDKDPLILALLILLAFAVVLLAGFGFAMFYLKQRGVRDKATDDREGSQVTTIHSLSENVADLIRFFGPIENKLEVISKQMSDLIALEDTRLKFRVQEQTALQQSQIDLAKAIYRLDLGVKECQETLQKILIRP